MTEDDPTSRPYLPAMGQRRLLPLYDAFARLAGARGAQQQLVAQAAIGSADRVLEIGAGTGVVLVEAKRAVPTATVIGLDPDTDALALARRRAAAAGLDLELDVGYADDLPHADGSVDRVLSSFMFHHLPGAEKPAALAEAFRVLRPGGSVHLVDIGGGGHRPETVAADALVAMLATAGFAAPGIVGGRRTLVGDVTFYRAER